jgi:hypothetical protein
LDLFSFHADQQYSCTVEQVLEQAITIAGYENDVQATTCLQYIDQTWGESGVHLLRILQQAVAGTVRVDSSSQEGTQLAQRSPDELSISAFYSQGTFIVTASGIPYSVAEVGEILAWLAASLQSSPTKQGAVSCWAVASVVPRNRSRLEEDEVTHLCKIGVRFQDLNKRVSDDSSGGCWLDSFRNPVVVQGYPILRRSPGGGGLEVPIGIMMSLVNANYLVDFCRRTYLKGFSTMLVVTDVIGSTVFWHLFYNKDGSYISYEDARIPWIQENEAAQTLDHATLGTGRHILGWCKKVSCLAGRWLWPFHFELRNHFHFWLTSYRNTQCEL